METLENQIRSLIIESLNLEGMSPEEIADDTPLFGEEGLGLDSIDALELGMAVKKRFGVNLSGTTEENRSRFASVLTFSKRILNPLSLKRGLPKISSSIRSTQLT